MVSALTAAEILQAWERGAPRNSGGRGLVMLGAAHPELGADALAGLTVGRRDALLLELRQRTFGPDLAATARCPACAEALEFTLRTSDIRQEKIAPLLYSEAQPLVFQWSRPGCQVTFRLPTAGDLESIGDGSIGDGSIGDGSIGDGSAQKPGFSEKPGFCAERALLARCVLAAELDGAAVTGGALPEDVAAEVAAAIGAAAAEHDPQAEILLNLACPACGHAWQAPFDIAGFLWAEIAAQARRLLYEVDALARAYGWREADILALTPARRQAYLDMVQG